MSRKRPGVLRRAFSHVIHPIQRSHRQRAHRRVLHRHRHIGLVKEMSSERFELDHENRRLLGMSGPGLFAPHHPPAAVDESESESDDEGGFDESESESESDDDDGFDESESESESESDDEGGFGEASQIEGPGKLKHGISKTPATNAVVHTID